MHQYRWGSATRHRRHRSYRPYCIGILKADGSTLRSIGPRRQKVVKRMCEGRQELDLMAARWRSRVFSSRCAWKVQRLCAGFAVDFASAYADDIPFYRYRSRFEVSAASATSSHPLAINSHCIFERDRLRIVIHQHAAAILCTSTWLCYR